MRKHALIAVLGTVAAALTFSPIGASASSHREAPLISQDPVADNTDTYAFVDPVDPSKVDLIANWIPVEVPSGGPNFYSFGDDVLYQIHIDNVGDAKDHIVFNVFSYLTFRSFMALISALVISLIVGPWLIRRLRRMQHGAETLREDTPEHHRTSKKGTPTMGGVIILCAILGSTFLWANLANRYVWVAMLAVAGYGLIGMWDDWTKIRTRRGIPARGKLAAQVILALALLQIVYWQPADVWQPVLAIPFFKGWLLHLGAVWFLFAMLVIIGASNAVNLTDGLDGLAIGPIVMAGAAFGVIAYLTGNFRAADYLKILNVRGAGELSVFCGALIGAAIGFLWFNCHPAEVFMGDAGSLALGAAIGMLAVLTKAELLLPLIGGIYVVEAVSVIVQVASFKLTGRRVFRMAPLHHHYELTGWPEPKIVVRFWIVSFALALLALTTLKLR